jgi:hypothetical protein
LKRFLAVLTAVLLCTSCASAANTPSAPQSPTSSTATASAPTSLSAGGQSQAPGGIVPPTLGISWDEDSKKAAVDVASKAMAAFARPKAEATQWANDFARWLTPHATAAYSAVDPANIPVSKVTGPATLAVDETNGYGVIATVPTDIGPYKVHLLRASQDSPWKVNRLTPPSSR